VGFARGEAREDCSTVFSLVGEKSSTTFDGYLSQVLQPGFWSGTIAFIRISMTHGVNIVSHFFNISKQPDYTSTLNFLRDYLPTYVQHIDPRKTVHIFIHQYRQMLQCKPSMYNHFATLIPVAKCHSDDLLTLKSSLEAGNTPWWSQVRDEKGYDRTAKESKGKEKKNQLNKEDRKKINEALTYHYLKNSDKGLRLALEMMARLERAQQKEAELAASMNVSVEDLDCGVASAESDKELHEEKTARTASLTSIYERRNWLQRAKIISIHLHPKMGGRISKDTSEITGVKENMLLTWLVQPRMIAGWIDLVECMNAETAMESLPNAVKDLFCTVYPESKVCVQRYRKKMTPECQQLKILFKGGKVSSPFLIFFLTFFVQMLINLHVLFFS